MKEKTDRMEEEFEEQRIKINELKYENVEEKLRNEQLMRENQNDLEKIRDDMRTKENKINELKFANMEERSRNQQLNRDNQIALEKLRNDMESTEREMNELRDEVQSYRRTEETGPWFDFVYIMHIF